MISMKQILVPTDFSDPSDVAMKYGKAFAETFGARLHLLHVVEDSMVTWPSAEGTDMLAPLALDELERRAREQLAKTLTAEETAKFQAQLVTVYGGPSMEIVTYAQSEKIDLIIMGTHGRGPITHMLMGSVAEKVVRKAPCPVLTVRQSEHEFVVT